MLRDPNILLTRPVAQAIVSGVHVQLLERGWRVREIRAADEYVYLLADIPHDAAPYTVIRDLKRRSAQIAHATHAALDPATLWAEGYLIVTPGRRLEIDEIRQFVQFERMM
jgi:REP element-mobilizing transposase RayT